MSRSVYYYKWQAKNYYATFMREADAADCGIALLKEVNPRAAKAAADFNDAMYALKQIDPSCPDYEPL